MQQLVAAIQVALRVLTAITEGRNPAPQDVEALKRLAPTVQYKSIDELACTVVQDALKHRAKVRAAREGS